jgi:MoxR-like ATPase
MVSMQTPLAGVQAAWNQAFPGQPFPGKPAAVAALSTAQPVKQAAPVAPQTTPANNALSQVSDKLNGQQSVIESITDTVISLRSRLNDSDGAIARLDDRLTGEVQGIAGQLSGIAATVTALTLRPAIDPALVSGQVAAAVREAFAPFRTAVEESGKVAEVAAIADALPLSYSDPVTVFGVPVPDRKGNPLTVYQYASPRAESVDPVFIWQPEILRHLLLSQTTAENVWLGGEKGTGKSETVRQFAARTGREYVRINFHKYSTAEEIIGATGLNNGATEFQPGPFLRAFSTPGCVILLDEPTNADPGELAILNGLLEPGAAVTIGGAVWRRAPGVLVFAADNTLTNGDSSGRYAGTRQMNSAFADRFARIVPFDYLPLAVEVRAVTAHTGCRPELAEHILNAIGIARAKVHTGDIIDAPSLRSVIAFVRALQVMDTREAWNSTIAARQPQESALALQGIFESCINTAHIDSLI